MFRKSMTSRFIVAVLGAIVLGSVTVGIAQTVPQRTAVAIAGWSLPQSSVDLNFARNAGSCTVNRVLRPCVTLISTSRASTEYAQWADGHWSSFAANTPAITDLGLWSWEARTNVVRYDRDLTNGAWMPTNVTAALDQTGIDGAANSASSITATASNGIILQAITLGSSARFETAFVKRLVGTGTIEMTMDGGSTWTAISPTTSWSRASIPTQTLANPSVGFRIGTSGDSIAVDFVQNENGVFATPPILTTGSAATRAADNISLIGPALAAFKNASGYSALVKTGLWASTAAATIYLLTEASTNRFIYGGATDLNLRTYNGSSALTATFGSGTLTTSDIKVGAKFAPSGRAIVANGGAVSSDANTNPIPSVVYLGSLGASANINGSIKRLVVMPPLDNSSLAAAAGAL